MPNGSLRLHREQQHDRRPAHPVRHRAGRPVRRRSSSCRWSTTSCASWRRRSWPRRSPARRSTPRPWSTRRTCGSSADRQFASRRHFFAAAAEAMRLILIDNARRKGTAQSRRRPPPGPSPRRCSGTQHLPRRAVGPRRCPDPFRRPGARQGRAGQAALLRPHEQPGGRRRPGHLRRHRRALAGRSPAPGSTPTSPTPRRKKRPRREGVGTQFLA